MQTGINISRDVCSWGQHCWCLGGLLDSLVSSGAATGSWSCMLAIALDGGQMSTIAGPSRSGQSWPARLVVVK